MNDPMLSVIGWNSCYGDIQLKFGICHQNTET